jgi:hypothetical protein
MMMDIVPIGNKGKGEQQIHFCTSSLQVEEMRRQSCFANDL